MIGSYFDARPIAVRWLHLNTDVTSAAFLLTTTLSSARIFPPQFHQFWIYLPCNLLQDALVIASLNLLVYYAAAKRLNTAHAMLQEIPFARGQEKAPLLSKQGSIDIKWKPPVKSASNFTLNLLHIFLTILSVLCNWYGLSSFMIRFIYDKTVDWESMIQAIVAYETLKGFAPTTSQMILPVLLYILSIGLLVLITTCIRLLAAQEKCRKLLYGSLGLFCFTAVALRPRSSSVNDNMLFSLGKYASAHLRSHKVLYQNTGGHLYGQSNINLPLDLDFLQDSSIEHIFVVTLESMNRDSVPYNPNFCKDRGCDDMDSKYNNAEHFTPFLSKLAKESLLVENFMTTSAFSSKSKGSTICGDFFAFNDFCVTEATAGAFKLPCLPKLMSGRWGSDKTHNIEVEGYRIKWDYGDVVAQMEGFDETYARLAYAAEHNISAGHDWIMVPDKGAVAHILDFVDAQLAAGNHTVVGFHTTNQHWPWFPADDVEWTHYSRKSAIEVNNYLNLLPSTDAAIQVLVEGLEKRDILDKSAIIVFGDHGSRIQPDGSWSDEKVSFVELQTPLFIRTRKTAEWANLKSKQLSIPSDRLVYALDVVPTLLDMMKAPSQLISAYSGHSMLRGKALRNTFHSQMPGSKDVSTISHDGKWAVLRKKGQNFCAHHLQKDAKLEFGWCTEAGYQGRVDPQSGKWTDSRSFLTEEEIRSMQAFTAKAAPLIQEHQDRNAEYYSNGTANALLQADFLQQWAIW